MRVKDLIALLKRQDPEARIVKLSPQDGYTQPVMYSPAILCARPGPRLGRGLPQGHGEYVAAETLPPRTKRRKFSAFVIY